MARPTLETIARTAERIATLARGRDGSVYIAMTILPVIGRLVREAGQVLTDQIMTEQGAAATAAQQERELADMRGGGHTL